MSIFICKTLSHFRCLKAITSTHKLLHLQYHPLSSSALDSITKCSNKKSFTVSYLINSFGLTPNKALIASQYLKFETPEKPDSVIAFFKKHKFKDTQISRIVKNYPAILLYDCEKTILPKLEFFTSMGVSSSDLTDLIAKSPCILSCSLENKIIPTFSFLNTLLPSNERAVSSIKRFFMLWGHDLEARIQPNITALRELGVPESKIVFLLTHQPTVLTMATDKFKKKMEEVKQMGFNPLKVQFVCAVNALTAMNKTTWEKKVEIFKKWGWSEDDILVAFKKHPGFMMASEDKLSSMMDFLITKSGFESSDIVQRPLVLSFSLEKRIVPRCSVYQVLLEKGLLGKKFSLSLLLEIPENKFLKKILNCYKEDAPELLKVYREKLEVSRLLGV